MSSWVFDPKRRVPELVKKQLSMRSRTRVAHARLRLRAPTAGQRMLPDFLVIGTMRGGTSSLYKYLSGHPDVAPPLRKEVEYFTRYFERGPAWYRRHFPLRLRGRVHEGLHHRALRTFEATPYYLLDPRAPSRAQAQLPDARLVVLLRDPVDRAYSHYQHAVRLGFEQLSFAEAVESEDARLAPELSRLSADDDYSSRVHHRFSYLARGDYAAQLNRWLDHYPRNQLLLVESSDLYAQPARTYGTVLEFLGLAPWQPATFGNHSYVAAVPQRSRIDPALREELRARFEDADNRLTLLWDRPPSWVHQR